MAYVIEIGDHRWAITKHALTRALDMCIDETQILAALRQPDMIYASRKYPGSKHYRLGDFALSIDFSEHDIPTICTIVWATDEAWRADLSHHPYDREYRPV